MKELIGNCYVDGNVATGFCDELEEKLIIPNGTISIKENAFSEYYGVTTIDFPDTLQTIGRAAFHKCSSLRKLNLPKSVINIEEGYFIGVFSECKQLIEADLSETKIKLLNNTFWGCKKLQKVKLPGTLIKIGKNTFFNCTNLTSLELKEGLKIIECDFEDNIHLSILNIPNSVIHIEDLSNNKNIKTIVISKYQYEIFKEYLPAKSKILFKD